MSSQSNFHKVRDFHSAFGLTLANEHNTNVFEDTKLIDLRLNLIKEELGELQEAIQNKDFTEVRDALADILYVTYGAAASFGIQADDDFDIVHKSNMTKLCTSEDEAQKTVDWYKSKFDSGESPYDSPAFRKSDDDQYWVVYNQSSGKILKSINYIKVNFT